MNSLCFREAQQPLLYTSEYTISGVLCPVPMGTCVLPSLSQSETCAATNFPDRHPWVPHYHPHLSQHHATRMPRARGKAPRVPLEKCGR